MVQKQQDPLLADDEQIKLLNYIDMGLIGVTNPQVDHLVDHLVDKGRILWVVEDSAMVQRYVPEEELKYYSEADQDNWAGAPSEQELA